MSGPNSVTTTDGIRVEAAAQLVPERSHPDRGRWFYAYRVKITNEREERVQLLSRRWIVLDADKGERVVEGPGVVGEQPILSAGESFEYRSFCDLPTAWGTMEGSYTFADAHGEEFEARVGRFFLAENAGNEAVLS